MVSPPGARSSSWPRAEDVEVPSWILGRWLVFNDLEALGPPFSSSEARVASMCRYEEPRVLRKSPLEKRNETIAHHSLYHGPFSTIILHLNP